MEKEKIILWIVIAVLLVIIIFSTLGFKITRNGASIIGGSGNMPEKCKLPAGQDIQSWKEHLGHHTDTQECLKYYG